MRLKRIEAATVAEGMRRLRAELGEHAVILHTKTVDGIGGGRIEILGAVDEPATRWPSPHATPPSPAAPAAGQTRAASAPAVAPARGASTAAAGQTRRAATAPTAQLQPALGLTPAAEGQPALGLTPGAQKAQAFAPPQLKTRVGAGKPAARTEPMEASPPPARGQKPAAQRAAPPIPTPPSPAADRRAEIAARLARFHAAVPTVPLTGADAREAAPEPARAVEPAALVAPAATAGPTFTASSWERMPGRARRVAFVGPTGAGKTTTLAKIAARAQLDHGRRVSLITIDTYRIGAVPQLASYAEILGVPLLVAHTPAELARAVEETRDADIVYIDTVGRSPLGGGVEGLGPFLDAAAPDEVCLVLSATTRPADSLRAATSYGRLRPDRLCVTKLDETDDHSTVPLLSEATRLPLSWLGTGQGVPDDLEAAEPARLARLNTGRAA